ncbi:MAG: Rieske 2Fe-2S domain-containing protein [Acidiphilium sp.]|nr:Rieske 2Fe-2S domain-containing protein [Acidiphilium sp.]MDD4935143.1 Rieske 2Fe-2S domain-containing protein [Acidiphilium sp.]
MNLATPAGRRRCLAGILTGTKALLLTKCNEDNMNTSTVYAICAMSDIPSQKAKGFLLMRVDDDGMTRPWPVVVVRWGQRVFGYVNKCPHDGVTLDWERNQFLDPNGIRLMCGKHGALFELGTGICVEGPCKGRSLQPVALSIFDGDICITDVKLVEDDEVLPNGRET